VDEESRRSAGDRPQGPPAARVALITEGVLARDGISQPNVNI